MKLYLISDNTETYEGMRLAGVDGMVTGDADASLKALDGIASHGEYAVVMVTEKIYAAAKVGIDRFKQTHTRPLVTCIPDRHGKAEDAGSIEDYIRSGIGFTPQ